MIRVINDKKYEVVELLGNKVLFTSLRIRNSEVPIGLFKYELRHADADGMTPCEISNQIMVNHYGTILTNKHIPMLHNGCTLLDGDKDMIFLDDYITVGAYKQRFKQQAVNKKKDLSR